jgi:hypothetical protein
MREEALLAILTVSFFYWGGGSKGANDNESVISMVFGTTTKRSIT